MATNRKDEHLSIVLEQRHRKTSKTTGLEALEFSHCALPEIDFDDIKLYTSFLGKRISAPLLVSAMTGGPSRAATINANIAHACESMGLPFAVGSQRVAIEQGDSGGLDRSLRAIAPSVPILGNLGAAQLNLGFGIDEARRAVEMIDADALYIHLNPLQEAVQPEGNRNWSGLFDKIVAVADALDVPIAIKEVGFGISATLAKRFVEAGISIIDVAGAGGTNWATVEAARSSNKERARLAGTFAGWGISTADAVLAIRRSCPEAAIIASGGISSGVDIAKAVRLGADLAGLAAGILSAANDSVEALIGRFELVIEELRIACFCTGSKDLDALRSAPLQSSRQVV
jgi:isopentenyl-diphosphate Delta-isomerase